MSALQIFMFSATQFQTMTFFIGKTFKYRIHKYKPACNILSFLIFFQDIS